MLRHVGNHHAVGRGQRVQSTDQMQQIAVASDPSETRFKFNSVRDIPPVARDMRRPPAHV